MTTLDEIKKLEELADRMICEGYGIKEFCQNWRRLRKLTTGVSTPVIDLTLDKEQIKGIRRTKLQNRISKYKNP